MRCVKKQKNSRGYVQYGVLIEGRRSQRVKQQSERSFLRSVPWGNIQTLLPLPLPASSSLALLTKKPPPRLPPILSSNVLMM